MQLKMQTDYAVRTLLYFAAQKKVCTACEISESTGINKTTMMRVLQKLKTAGWISSSAGGAGGFMLVANPQNISLWEVMKATEDTVRVNRCLEDDGFCSRNGVATCPVHKIYASFQEISEWYFSSVTISELLEPDGLEAFCQSIVADVREKVHGKSAGKEVPDQ